jgi:hypothetical protein
MRTLCYLLAGALGGGNRLVTEARRLARALTS